MQKLLSPKMQTTMSSEQESTTYKSNTSFSTKNKKKE